MSDEPQQIRTLGELMAAARGKKSVCCPGQRSFAGPTPAAFAANYTGSILNQLLESGMFIYTPKPKTKSKP